MCECGHEADDHAATGFFKNCLVEGCRCDDYTEVLDVR